MENQKIVQVDNLKISFKTDNGKVQAVRGVSFDLYKGETLCIVGESGSGKSVTSKAIMGILANNAIIEGGSIFYEGEDLLKVSEEEFHRIRGSKIGMIFQDPLSSLNPIMKIGKQITEAMLINSDRLKVKYNDLIADKLIAYKNISARLNYDIEALKNALETKITEEQPSKAEIKVLKAELKSKIKELKKAAKAELKVAKEALKIRKKEAKIEVENYKKQLIEERDNLIKAVDTSLPEEEYKKQVAKIQEDFILKTKITKAEAKAQALKIMAEVGIPYPEKRFNQYPFEFSGGMRQRIVIAIALTANPDVLICDEPTTALDVTIQAQILELINKLKRERGLSCIFITHDLGVVANMADRVAVMYAGKIVEYGKAEEIFYDPRHPYTWALLSSIPDVDSKERLESIPGTPPNMIYPPKGDAFADRNKYAMQIDFEKEPPYFEITETHKAATWLLHPYAPKVEMPAIVRERIRKSLEMIGSDKVVDEKVEEKVEEVEKPKKKKTSTKKVEKKTPNKKVTKKAKGDN